MIIKEVHRHRQSANDWVQCTCGKIFSDSKTITAREKFWNHVTEMEAKENESNNASR